MRAIGWKPSSARPRPQTPIEKIALREGLLTIRDVQEVLRVSADSRMLFGDAAVELGFLLATQRDERPAFASVLSAMNRVDPGLLKEAIEDWEGGIS